MSEIVNNPHPTLLNSLFGFITENFGNLSYNPHLTELTVPPSPDIPFVDPADLDVAYRKTAAVLISSLSAIAVPNHGGQPQTGPPICCSEE